MHSVIRLGSARELRLRLETVFNRNGFALKLRLVGRSAFAAGCAARLCRAVEQIKIRAVSFVRAQPLEFRRAMPKRGPQHRKLIKLLGAAKPRPSPREAEPDRAQGVWGKAEWWECLPNLRFRSQWARYGFEL